MSDTGRVCDEDANCTNPNLHIHVHTGYVGKSVTITNFGGNTYSLPVRADPVPAHVRDFARVNGDAIPDAELHADEPAYRNCGPHCCADPATCRVQDANVACPAGADPNPHFTCTKCVCGADLHPGHACPAPIPYTAQSDPRPCRNCAASNDIDSNATGYVVLTDSDGHRHAYRETGEAVYKPKR